MKYSLKNKEFSRKRLTIFDKCGRQSRSRSKSMTPRKSEEKKTQQNIQNQYTVQVSPPGLNNSAIDKLNSLDSHSSSMHVNRVEESPSLFESFAKVDGQGSIARINSKQMSKFASSVYQTHAIRNTEPIKIIDVKKLQVDQFGGKIHSEMSEKKSESFQVCDETNPSRINRFFQESVMGRESESPHNKVVFEPIIRKSLSRQRSQSPVPRQQPIMSKVTPINLKIEPQRFSVPSTCSNGQRRVQIIQIAGDNSVGVQLPQRVIGNQAFQNNPHSIYQQIGHNHNNQFQALKVQRQLPPLNHEEQIFFLKNKLQQQSLQIQYLKNQKQLLESNISLNYTPKKQGLIKSPIAPEKYGKSVSMVQQIDRNKILQLAEILDQNQIKINFIEQKFSHVYSNIMQKYNQSLKKCQEILISTFTQKYLSFSQQLTTKLCKLQQQSAYVSNIDQKLQIFTNTFRSIQQNLRLTKMKQYNIELFLQNTYKKTDRFWKSEEPSNFKLLLENQSDISSIRRMDDNQLEDKDREELFRLQKNITGGKNQIRVSNVSNVTNDYAITRNNDDGIQQIEIDPDFDSFLDQKYDHLKYKPKKSKSKEKHHKQRSTQKRKEKHYRQNLNFQNYQPKKDFIMSDNFYDQSDKKYLNKSTSEQIQQFSPFQANQLLTKSNNRVNKSNLMQSEVIPSNDQIQYRNSLPSARTRSYISSSNKKHNESFASISQSQQFNFSQNSFQVQMDFKPSPKQNPKQISFTSKNMFKKPYQNKSSENQQISDTLQGQQERLIKLLKNKNHNFPVQCWIDELGCLRKKNQTYLFDQQGSVIMTTAAAFKKLKERKVLV